jgi:peptidoglycan/xylan/chitin deacetylase (PgdA/CDA1 family)
MNSLSFGIPAAIVLALFATGCTGSGSSVKDDVSQTIAANNEAKGHLEWENSGLTPEEQFAKWHTEKVSAEDVCGALLQQKDQELTIFENEIKNPKNANLVAPCKAQLIERLEEHWKRDSKSLGTAEVVESTPELPAESPEDSSAESPEQTGKDLFPEAPVAPKQNAVPPEQKIRVKPPVENRPAPSAKVQDIRAGFTFPEVIAVRDFSNGYFVVNGELKTKEVLLTFDDGPHGEYSDRILAALAKVRASAIFFSMGQSVRANPDTLRRIAKAGHGIGSHSMNHRCLAFKQKCAINNKMERPLTFAEAVAEITGGHQAIQNVLGWVDPFFRFPYGESTTELKKYLQNKSVGEFNWSVDSNDWKNQSSAQMIEATMSALNQRGRGVLLFHDVHRRTAEALPELLRQLYFGGYSVVTMKASDSKARFASKLTQKMNVAKASAEIENPEAPAILGY